MYSTLGQHLKQFGNKTLFMPKFFKKRLIRFLFVLKTGFGEICRALQENRSPDRAKFFLRFRALYLVKMDN